MSSCLKQELLDRKMIRSDDHWDELQVSFLEKHQYYTASAKEDRNALKEKHLEEIKNRIAKKEQNKVVD